MRGIDNSTERVSGTATPSCELYVNPDINTASGAYFLGFWGILYTKYKANNTNGVIGWLLQIKRDCETIRGDTATKNKSSTDPIFPNILKPI